MTCTHTDICFVVNKLSQCMSQPTHANLSLAKFVLKYLKGTIDKGLTFRGTERNEDIVGFCDADWAGSSDRKSISGYIYLHAGAISPVSWRSKKQATVALSTCEAEYVSVSHAVQEAKFLRQLKSDLTGIEPRKILLQTDNKSAIELAKNPINHQRSKHIDIKHHFIRDEIKSETICLDYVPTDDNLADVFTKPMSKFKLSKFNLCH